MLSNEPLKTSNSPSREQIVSFLALNQEVFQFVAAFVEMSRGFKFGFVEINFPPDADALIMALQEHPKCQNVQFVILNFDDPDLRFLLEALKQSVAETPRQPDKKIVLILRGLERAIGLTVDYPPVLTNLNYARDNFPEIVPHPILFFLPDYAVTKFAQFAPDFWAWTAGTFKFQTAKATLDHAIAQSANDKIISIDYTYPKAERQERIDLLERLLQEYPEDTEASSRNRLEVITQLGQAHKSIRQFDIAKNYFQQALELSKELKYERGEAHSLYNLGDIYRNLRQFNRAKSSFNQSLELNKQIGDRQNTAGTYHMLGTVAQDLRQWDEAKLNYLKSLEINEEFGDRYAQESTYHNLGMVAQNLQQWDEAKLNYLKSLEIKEKFGDRYSQASTYHHLGMVAQELRQWDEAKLNYLKALEIKEEFDDRYSQTMTYHNLGVVAQELQQWDEAKLNYFKSLEIKEEFGDRYSQAGTYYQLGRVAQELRQWDEAKLNYLKALEIFVEFKDEYSIETYSIPMLAQVYKSAPSDELLAAIAKILGVSVEEVRSLLQGS